MNKKDPNNIPTFEEFTDIYNPQRETLDYFLVYDPEVMILFSSILLSSTKEIRIKLINNDAKKYFCETLRKMIDLKDDIAFKTKISKFFDRFAIKLTKLANFREDETRLFLKTLAKTIEDNIFFETNLIQAKINEILNRKWKINEK